MEKEPKEDKVITAEDVLKEFIATVQESWNGYGARLWAEYKLKEIEGKNDDCL